MYMYIHIYIYIYVYMFTHKIDLYMYIHIFIHIYIYIYIFIYIHICIYRFICIYIYIYIYLICFFFLFLKALDWIIVMSVYSCCFTSVVTQLLVPFPAKILFSLFCCPFDGENSLTLKQSHVYSLLYICSNSSCCHNAFTLLSLWGVMNLSIFVEVCAAVQIVCWCTNISRPGDDGLVTIFAISFQKAVSLCSYDSDSLQR